MEVFDAENEQAVMEVDDAEVATSSDDDETADRDEGDDAGIKSRKNEGLNPLLNEDDENEGTPVETEREQGCCPR